MDNQLAISILNVHNKVQMVKKLIAQNLKWIHYDVMDGLFVKNKSLDLAEMFYILQNSPKHIVDIHLMVNDPLKYFKELKGNFDYLTFHYESMSIKMIYKFLRRYGSTYNIGIAIKPKTNPEQILEFLPFVSHVLIMSVEPGAGGQKFNQQALNKITKIKSYLKQIKRQEVFVQVDGGINDMTGPQAILAGASSLVSGSFALKSLNQPDILSRILET